MKSNVEVFDGDDDVPIVERVAAVDVAKASGMVCTRVPHATIPGRRLRTWLVNARDVKQVPGRAKTDGSMRCGWRNSTSGACCARRTVPS